MGGTFLSDMKARLSDTSIKFARFGDIFLRLVPVLRIYSVYIRNYDNVQSIIQKKMLTNPSFALFIKNIESKNNEINFYLIQIIQRLPRYEMLVKQLLAYTPITHVDFNDITSALDKIKAIAFEVNRMKAKDSR
jgi:hypothetical protein